MKRNPQVVARRSLMLALSAALAACGGTGVEVDLSRSLGTVPSAVVLLEKDVRKVAKHAVAAKVKADAAAAAAAEEAKWTFGCDYFTVVIPGYWRDKVSAQLDEAAGPSGQSVELRITTNDGELLVSIAYGPPLGVGDIYSYDAGPAIEVYVWILPVAGLSGRVHLSDTQVDLITGGQCTLDDCYANCERVDSTGIQWLQDNLKITPSDAADEADAAYLNAPSDGGPSGDSSSSSPSSPSPAGRQPFWGIWCFASKEFGDSQSVGYDLQKKGFPAFAVETTDYANLNTEHWWAVCAGRFGTEAEANAALAAVQNAGYPDAYVKYSGDWQG